MKRFLLLIALVIFAAVLGSCSHTAPPMTDLYHPDDYQWHKNTIWIRLHWDYLHPDGDTVIADGFVEPFNQSNGVHTVRLELVGLDRDGNVVNAAPGMPRDSYIVHPFDESPFTITMKLNGKEKRFTLRGTYYYYDAGEEPFFSQPNHDYIPTDDVETR